MRSFMAQVPHPAYWNLYGPTETNVCTYHRVKPANLTRPEGIPIGRPVSATRTWVVNEDLQPVPSGTVGELLVAGPTLLAGYYQDDRSTAERLIAAPDGVGRAYRTGDRAVDRGGVLMFQGRQDRMVKSRGYRIELAEVEAVLAENAAIGEAAVVAVGHRMRGTTLTGFVSVQDGEDLTPRQLNAYCRQYLPKYMVPQGWRFVDRLPRTPHGKIDLTALSQQAT